MKTQSKYYVLEISDSCAAEFPTNYKWNDEKSFSEFCNQVNQHKEIPNFSPNLQYKIYNDPNHNQMNDFIFGSIDEFCVSEKMKNIFQQFNLPIHQFYEVDVFYPRKKDPLEEKYFAFYYNFYHLQNILTSIDFLKSDIFMETNDKKQQQKINSLSAFEEIDVLNNENSNEIKKLSKTKKSREQFSEKIKLLHEQLWNYTKPKTIYFSDQFDFSLDLFEIPQFSNMTYISERLKNAIEEENITGVIISEPGERQYKVHRPNPNLIWNL